MVYGKNAPVVPALRTGNYRRAGCCPANYFGQELILLRPGPVSILYKAFCVSQPGLLSSRYVFETTIRPVFISAFFLQ